LDYIYEKYIRHSDDSIINFFFDVKNGIYNKDNNINEDNKFEHAIEFISGVINVIQYIKNRYSTYFDIRNRLRFFFFCETGKSSYHKGIDMGYKSNRGLNDYLTRTKEDELFSQTTYFSIYTLNDIINMIPNSFFFLGEFKEFDYIPYVVYKRFFKSNDIGIVYSTDKDMYQLQSYTNCFEQLEKNPFPSKWHPGRLFINKDNYIERLLAKDMERYELTNDDKEFISNNFSLFRGIVGDAGDGVPGIKGIGYITFLKLFNKFSLKNIIMSRDFYNEKIKKMDFSKFDFKRESVLYDLEKIKDMEKEIKSSNTLKKLLDVENIKRVCMNIALMDYDVMYDRRISKDKDEIDSKLYNNNKFRSPKEIEKFINKTNLWTNHSYHKITITI
jgi:hypothetical protein